MPNLEPTIIFIDNQIMVVQKPVGMPSQADKRGQLDLLTWGKMFVKRKYAKPGEAWLGLVHRLDQPVGGVMVFARTSKAAARLSESVRNHELNKTYFAVCHGCPQDATWNDKWSKGGERVVIAPMGEKEASLSLTTLASVKDGDATLSLVEINLHTGRKHQIRAQFAYHNCPLVGDRRYGLQNALDHKAPSVALFAAKLAFSHPTTKELLTFRALPDAVYPFNQEKIWSSMRASLE